MSRILYLVMLTLVLATIIHIVIILILPSFAARDAWATLAKQGKPWEFTLAVAPNSAENAAFPDSDPSFAVAACRFNLSESALVVEAKGDLAFWSVALFDRRGRNTYSFNDRTAIGRKLFLIVVDAVQMSKLRKNPTEEVERAVLIETDLSEGFVLVRALQSDPSEVDELSKFIRNATCRKYQIAEE